MRQIGIIVICLGIGLFASVAAYYELSGVQDLLKTAPTGSVNNNCATSECAHNPENRRAQFLFSPNATEAVKKWTECLDTIFICRDERETIQDDSTQAEILRACVSKSACPIDCRTRFAVTARRDDFVEEAFHTVFLEAGGYCVPTTHAP